MSLDERADDAMSGPINASDPVLLRRRRSIPLLLAASLAINVLVVAFEVWKFVRKGGLQVLSGRFEGLQPEHAPFQLDMVDRYARLPHSDQDIVFLGDSQIAAGPWADFYGPVKNRGIGGQTSGGLLDVLDRLKLGRPRAIFLLVGTNDLANEVPLDQVVRNHDKLLGRIKAEGPSTSVVVLGVLPVNQSLGPVQSNGDVRELNRRLAAMIREKHPDVTFLDLTDFFMDGAGDLRRDLTTDGLHLSFEGYLLLEQHIREFVPSPVPRSGPVTDRE